MENELELDLDLNIGDIGFDNEGVDLANFDLSNTLESAIESRIIKPAYYRGPSQRMIKAGRSGKNTARNLDAAMKANAARSRANKAKQGSKKSDPNFLPF